MHGLIALMLGRSFHNAHWFDLIMFGIAAAAVFPEMVLGKISERTGKEFGWWHVLSLEIIIVIFVTISMTVLMRFYAELRLYYPLLFVGIVIVMRGVMWCVLILNMFGSDSGSDD
jgi:hypothetical protein